MNNLYFQLILILNINFIINAIECDFDKFITGCGDSFGTECNKTSNQCQCKTGFTVKVEDFCLLPKNLSEPCFISAQCQQHSGIANIGCFIEDKEIDIKILKLWINSENVYKIIGVCVCPPNYYLNSSKECVPKKLYNENCSSSQECISVHSYCDQSSQQCKCKPTYRYSIRKSRCISQLIGESCIHTENCVIHDPNAECRIGSCQCRPGFILSTSGKCVYIRIKGTSNHLLMMLVVVGTAVVFALLSTAHRKWSSNEDFFERNRNQVLNDNLITRRNFHMTNNYHTNSGRPPQTYPMSLSAPSLALIWPIRQQNNNTNNQICIEEGPPSYAEAVGQCFVQTDNICPESTNNSNTNVSSCDNNNNDQRTNDNNSTNNTTANSIV